MSLWQHLLHWSLFAALVAASLCGIAHMPTHTERFMLAGVCWGAGHLWLWNYETERDRAKSLARQRERASAG